MLNVFKILSFLKSGNKKINPYKKYFNNCYVFKENNCFLSIKEIKYVYEKPNLNELNLVCDFEYKGSKYSIISGF